VGVGGFFRGGAICPLASESVFFLGGLPCSWRPDVGCDDLWELAPKSGLKIENKRVRAEVVRPTSGGLIRNLR